MCGLLAEIGTNVSEESFRESLDTLSHRGPDVHGNTLMTENYKFGHQKLAITDPGPQSDQPMQSDDKKITLIFNGQIYNFKELVKEHSLSPRTESDSEVLILMYSKYGTKMLNYLNGDFSFVIYDETSNQYFAARDRFGVKPLYYQKTSKGIAFSSETIALLKLNSGISLNNFSERVFKEFRGLFDDLSYFNEIKSLPPGSLMVNGKISKYWELPDNEGNHVNLNDLENQIKKSVTLRVATKTETTTLLSGGIDSALVTALSKSTHSWIVGTDNFNEFVNAQVTADFLGIYLEKVVQKEDCFLDIAKGLIISRKSPLGVPNEVLLSELFENIKKNYKVILSGEGADELFLGYDRIFRWAQSASKFDLAQFAEMYSYNRKPDLEIFDFALQDCYSLATPIRIVERFFQTKHIQVLLNRLDMISMRSGVEARVPFLDHNLIELVHLSNVEDRLNNQQSKVSLRKIAKNYMPDSVANQTKVGFPFNLGALFPISNGKIGRTSEKDSYQKWLDWSYNEFSSAAKT